jgi:hypothetical protein
MLRLPYLRRAVSRDRLLRIANLDGSRVLDPLPRTPDASGERPPSGQSHTPTRFPGKVIEFLASYLFLVGTLDALMH